MIRYNGNTNLLKGKKKALKDTLKKIAKDHEFTIGELDYIFISDEELLKINQDVLKHDYYTDIITFDYTEEGIINGEIYISLDRVAENAATYKEVFHVELSRVIFHGLLHITGYKDKTKKDKEQMREMENQYIKQYLKTFHVEQ